MSFSALQRAENSSMHCRERNLTQEHCFSALQRAENSSIIQKYARTATGILSFSALQRAENSSIVLALAVKRAADRFSALQRAENSSIPRLTRAGLSHFTVSVLFSEPKIPQS